jgi:UDP-N-acetylmuramate dehydrogenase
MSERIKLMSWIVLVLAIAALMGVTFEEVETDVVRATVAAGEDWDQLVAATVTKGLHGLENLSYIPGSVGGAVVQNIGAYGVEIKSCVESVEVLDTLTEQLVQFPNSVCDFAYRDSLFKRDRNEHGKRYVVTGVTLLLKKNGPVVLSYKDLEAVFTTAHIVPTVQSVRDAVISIRKKKLPDPKILPTAGSFFKNPIITTEQVAVLQKEYGEPSGVAVAANTFKISAAWLLEHVGNFKGVRQGDAGVYDLHALVLVNHGHATAREIFVLAKKMRDEVSAKTHIVLEPEVVLVGLTL